MTQDALKPFLPEFIKDLDEKGRSPSTILAYRADLDQLLDFLQKREKVTTNQTNQSDIVFTLYDKWAIVGIIADTTEAFAGLAGTISLKVGTTSGGAELILSHDVKTATVTKGIADADLGTSLNRANAVQGSLFNFSGSTLNVFASLVSGTGNLGDGATTNLTTGIVRLFIVTERYDIDSPV